MEIDEEWTTGRKYLNMDNYEACKKAKQAWRESAQACAKAAQVLTAPFAVEGNFTHNLGLELEILIHHDDGIPKEVIFKDRR